MTKFKIFFGLFLLVWILSACGKGVMDDQAAHSSNSDVTRNSLPSPDPGNTQTAGSGTLNPYPATLDNSGGSPATGAQNDFYTRAAQGGLAEVELSRLAQTNAQSPEVKQFAQMMLTDHSKANDELRSIASQKGVTLPAALDPKHQAIMQRLQGLKGAEFDAAYVEAMIQDHEETTALFRTQSQNAADPQAQAFAAKHLPAIEGHLKMARSIGAAKRP